MSGFKRLGDDYGAERKQRRLEMSFEERLDHERAPMEAKILAFLQAHGCNADGRVIVDFGLLKVFLFAEMVESYCEMYRSSRRKIPPTVLDLAFRAMDTASGWVNGANVVTKRVVIDAEVRREISKLEDDLKVTSTYNVPDYENKVHLAGHLVSLGLSFQFYDGSKFTITFRSLHQREQIEDEFRIGIPGSAIDPEGFDNPI